ncbi:MAG: hypothetical protein NC118_09690 [Eubacterium sp.]|nr:hypothetical protein [Eubacterium sp.]
MNGPVVPYLTAVTGIAFWLRTARILTPALPDEYRLLLYDKRRRGV